LVVAQRYRNLKAGMIDFGIFARRVVVKVWTRIRKQGPNIHKVGNTIDE
jgi:hypothetical protein